MIYLQGMACVGRTKECTIVPSNHYGPIPGIPVGTTWKFRVQVSCFKMHYILISYTLIKEYPQYNLIMEFQCYLKFFFHLQVSEAGVHRPHVGGIHGRSNDGSYSLVLAGGFEDEVVSL